MTDRDEPEASCPEWNGDGTAGEDDRVSHPGSGGTSSGDGETPSRTTPASLASCRRRRGSTEISHERGKAPMRS
jgi:hypothetical protein